MRAQLPFSGAVAASAAEFSSSRTTGNRVTGEAAGVLPTSAMAADKLCLIAGVRAGGGAAATSVEFPPRGFLTTVSGSGGVPAGARESGPRYNPWNRLSNSPAESLGFQNRGIAGLAVLASILRSEE